MNPFEVLGVEADASADEIKAAYRALAHIFHPDRYQDAPDAVQREANARMKQLTEAYRQLRDRTEGSSGREQSAGAQSSARSGSSDFAREAAPSTEHAPLHCPACTAHIADEAIDCPDCGLALDVGAPPPGSWMSSGAWVDKNL